MTRIRSAFLTILTVLLLPIGAHADLIQITATNDGPISPGAFSGFTVVYNDTGDGLLSLEELVSFSGVQELVGAMRVWVELVGTPDIAGISMLSGVDGRDFWFFADVRGQSAGWLDARWTYEVTSAVAVPEPATLALLGLGLAGMVLVRRRRRT